MSWNTEHGTYTVEMTGVRSIFSCDQCGSRHEGIVVPNGSALIDHPVGWVLLYHDSEPPIHLCSWECVWVYGQYRRDKAAGVVE